MGSTWISGGWEVECICSGWEVECICSGWEVECICSGWEVECICSGWEVECICSGWEVECICSGWELHRLVVDGISAKEFIMSDGWIATLTMELIKGDLFFSLFPSRSTFT